MPYRFRPDHPLGDEARRVARRQLEKARDLLDRQPDGLHAAIHQSRKAIKRVRALYRLVATDRKHFHKSENARLRDVASSLSALRDAAAFIETLTALCQKALNDDERRAINTALQALAERRDHVAGDGGDVAATLAHAIEQLGSAIAALDGFDLPAKPKKAARLLADGWQEALEKARVALENCSVTADAEAFHELRKATQTYWRHLALVEPVWPSAIAGKRTTAKTLAALLGRDHDIAMLASLLDREPELVRDDQTLSHLLGVLIREQQSLRRESLCLAGKLFADSPQEEADIIAALWLSATHRNS
ncbi:CHAD domain-containing protein [Rhizobium halophytocola]|uniref:CHAD domain-containing protein n=1 Tax=Rhizobium halophytocola TaxID=735519 RepID=A0ABS4DTI9_9HYPH|nr:CHAD domain-containing protein [Rhizobium halophytocola]MBP1848995.1 CHAD domain-containing protein [Rhizobium halophytocola]